MIREYISQSFIEDVYAILLQDIEIYKCRRNNIDYFLMIEGGESPTAYLFHLHELIDMIPISSGGDKGAMEAAGKMKLELMARVPVLDKLKAISLSSCLILIIREKELTRCGEYIELTFLLDTGAKPEKIKFIWNEEVPLSTMLKELLARYGFTIHTYRDKESLLEEIHRLIYYNCLSR